MNFEKFEKNGHIFYLVPEDVFLHLQMIAENERDIVDFDKAQSEETEFFPQSLLGDVLSGKNPVKAFREYRHLSQQELSDKTKLSRAYIAQIETGKKTGSITTLKSISKALNVDIELLIE